jgi:hypothetical protein
MIRTHSIARPAEHSFKDLQLGTGPREVRRKAVPRRPSLLDPVQEDRAVLILAVLATVIPMLAVPAIQTPASVRRAVERKALWEREAFPVCKISSTLPEWAVGCPPR